MPSFLTIFETIILPHVKRALIKANIDSCIMHMYIALFDIMTTYIARFDIMTTDIALCDIMAMPTEVNVVDMCTGELDMYLH